MNGDSSLSPQFSNTEVIQQYIDLLERCNCEDNQVREEAVGEIENLISEEIIGVVLILSSIILQTNCINAHAYLSLSWLRKIFTPVPPITEDDIAEKWLEVDQENRDILKMAIIRGLMFDDIQVVSITAVAFAALLNIEKTEMFDLIPRLYELYEDPQYSILTKAAAINVLAEISSKKCLGSHTDTVEVQEILMDIFSKIGSYYSECLNAPIDIRYNIANAIDTFLDVAVELFEGEDTVYSIIDITIENLGEIPRTLPPEAIAQPDQLHSTLLSILLKLIKMHYQNTEFNPENIFKFTINQILEYNNPRVDRDLISNYLYFWQSLADFEREIIKRDNFKLNLHMNIEKKQKKKRFDYEVTEEIKRYFCNSVMEDFQIVEKLVYIMLMIDPEDINSEDVDTLKDAKMPHAYATCCLQSFFKLNPHLIFEKIVTYWKQDMNKYFQNMCRQQEENPNGEYNPPQPLNWINDHTLLLTINIFCRKTITPNEITRDLHMFFFEPFDGNFIILRDYILGTCLVFCNIPKIIDTCLYSLSIVFSRYPEFLDENVYDIIIDWIKQNKEIRDPMIFIRIVYLITIICSRKISASIKVEVKARILENFGDFADLFEIGTSQPELIDNDIYRYSYQMMCNVLRFAIYSNHFSSIDNDNNIAIIIKSQLAIINECAEFVEDSYGYVRISQAIYLFNCIFGIGEKYVKPFIDFLVPIFDSYSRLLYPNSPLFEDCLAGLEVLIKHMDASHINILLRVNDAVNIGLSSYSPSIITRSAYIRAALYDKFITKQFEGYTELLDNFPSNYQMIVDDCLSNTEFTRDFYPYLLKALALIISACSEDIRENHPEIIDEFKSQYEKFAYMPLTVDKDNIDDVEYANIFYDSMFTFASSIMKCISDSNNLKTDRRFMKLMNDRIPPAYFENLEYAFEENSLIAFFEFLNQYNKTFGKKGNIILNRVTNYKILFHGMTNKNKKVSDLALETYYLVKNA